jgi:hypothetical protein
MLDWPQNVWPVMMMDRSSILQVVSTTNVNFTGSHGSLNQGRSDEAPQKLQADFREKKQ